MTAAHPNPGYEHGVEDLRGLHMRQLPLTCILVGTAALPLIAHPADSSNTATPSSVPTDSSSPSRWTYDFESSYVFWDIQNPFWLLAGQHGVDNMKNPWHYKVNSYIFGGRYDITEVGGWRFLRGYLQSSIGVIGADIVQGPEHYYAGLIGGLRYVFVPGDGHWTSYVEFREGAGATDASHVFYGQQNNLSFMYLLGVGVRFQPDSKRRISLGIVDQHMSDAYLTKENYGFDSVGFNVTVEWRP